MSICMAACICANGSAAAPSATGLVWELQLPPVVPVWAACMTHSLWFCSGSCSRRHLTTYCLTSSDERLCRLTSNSLASLLVIRGSLSCSMQATMVAATAKSLMRLPAENPAKDAERLGQGKPVQGSRQAGVSYL